MAANCHKQATVTHSKFLSQHILFKKASNLTRQYPFQTYNRNVQAFEIGQQDRGRPVPLFSPPQVHQASTNSAHCKDDLRRAAKIDNCHDRCFLDKPAERQRESPLKRAFSSKRLDFHPKKQSRRKGQKKMFPIFSYAKAVKGESTSKKSTDESSNGHMQTLRAENEEFREIIRSQEWKMRQLEHAILEEKKRHELQKHLYGQNIERLRRIARLQAQGEDFLSIVEDEDCDRLSIESN